MLGGRRYRLRLLDTLKRDAIRAVTFVTAVTQTSSFRRSMPATIAPVKHNATKILNPVSSAKPPSSPAIWPPTPDVTNHTDV